MRESSILVFDEPTNHLDIPMKETLEYSMREYEGAVIVVSHDRWFLSKTCKRMVAIEKGQVVVYEGDYRYYMDKNRKVRKAVEKQYIKGFDGIDSVPLTEAEIRKKERKGLRKNEIDKRRREQIARRRRVLGPR